MDKKQIKLEIQHIFDSGANEIRIFNMIERLLKGRSEETTYCLPTKEVQQKLFNYFSNEHDLLLLESDFHDIESILNEPNEQKEWYCWTEDSKNQRCKTQCDVCKNDPLNIKKEWIQEMKEKEEQPEEKECDNPHCQNGTVAVIFGEPLRCSICDK